MTYKVNADNLLDAWEQLLSQVCDSRNGDFDKFDQLCRHFYHEVDKCICEGQEVFTDAVSNKCDTSDLE